MTRPTIFIIDDQDSVRTALTEMLHVFGYAVEAFGSADDFLAAQLPTRLGCIVSDVRMPGMDGIELVRETQRRSLMLPIILISGHADVPMAVDGIKAGAHDFIEKPIDDVKLVAAINRGLAHASERDTAYKSVQALKAAFSRLTPRQAEVFDLVTAGYTSHAIADRLHISQRTVESYRTVVMEKMRAESIAVLVRQAVQIGRLLP